MQLDRPFTWGNWLSNQSSYNIISGVMGEDDPFICSDPCPISGIFYAEKFSSSSCNYVFAITIRYHSYGQTERCISKSSSRVNPALPFPLNYGTGVQP